MQAIAEGKTERYAGTGSREPQLVKVNADDDLSSALQLMATHQVRRLPVVDDDGGLVGILAQADVAREAKDKDSGQMLQDISQTPTGPRV